MLNYFSLFCFYNFTSIILTSDSTSFDTGFIWIGSLLFWINIALFVLFVSFETLALYLNKYGLTFDFFLNIIFQLKNTNLNLNIYYLKESPNYILFLIINLLFLKINKRTIYCTFKKKFRLITIFLITTIVLVTILKIDFITVYSERLFNKIKFYSHSENSFFREDNIYIIYELKKKYKKSDNKNKIFFSFKNSFRENTENTENIYIIINESYPNFKNNYYYEKLERELLKNLSEHKIKKYKKNWSKDFTTRGAELKLFCDSLEKFKEFENLNLDKFII